MEFRRLLFSLLITFFSAIMCYGQDIITLKDGTDIKAVVTEVGSNEIRYKDFENQSGPVYVLMKSEVFRIAYQNGKKDTFADQANQHQSSVIKGKMSLDRRTGRLSINGMNIDKQHVDLYLNPEEYIIYRKGDRVSSVGQIMWAVGAGSAVGWTIPTIISGGHGQIDYYVFGTSAVLVISGLLLEHAGLRDINKAINGYNSRHNNTAFTPEFNIGIQQHGLGLGLNF